MWTGADFSRLRDPEAVRRLLAASDYCFSYSDSDDEGTYDPTRECFYVKLRMPRAGDEDEGAGNRSLPREGVGDATPPRVEPLAARNENPAHEEPVEEIWQEMACRTPVSHLEPKEHSEPSHGIHTILPGLWSRGYPPH